MSMNKATHPGGKGHLLTNVGNVNQCTKILHKYFLYVRIQQNVIHLGSTQEWLKCQ